MTKYIRSVWITCHNIFAKNSFAGKMTLNDTNQDQSDLLTEIGEFNKNAKLKDIERKQWKRDTHESITAPYEGRKVVLNAFKSGTFLLPPTVVPSLKILGPKQIQKKVNNSSALAQVKWSNTSANLLN